MRHCENKRLKDDRCFIVFLINQWGATSVKAKLLWSTVIAGNLWEQDLLKPDGCALYYMEGKASFYQIALETQLYGKTWFTCRQQLFKSVATTCGSPSIKLIQNSRIMHYVKLSMLARCQFHFRVKKMFFYVFQFVNFGRWDSTHNPHCSHIVPCTPSLAIDDKQHWYSTRQKNIQGWDRAS